MKQYLLILLAALLTALSAHAYVFEVDGIYYYKLSSTEVAVTRGDYGYYGSITIPSLVLYEDTNYSVMSIENHAFYGCSGLTSVEIGNSVTSIGIYAF